MLTSPISVYASYMGKMVAIPLNQVMTVESQTTDSTGSVVAADQTCVVLINPSESFGVDSIDISQLEISIDGENLSNHIQVGLITKNNNDFPWYTFVATDITKEKGVSPKIYVNPR